MRDIPILKSISSLAADADVWLLDIWGVLHNGVRPFDATVAAARAFRKSGGTIVLVSNAPRPRHSVIAQLNRVGVPRDAYDCVVSSGDVARGLIRAFENSSVLHIGPERDVPVFEGSGVRLDACVANAAVAVCTGLYDDETETPKSYADLLRTLAARKLKMICANPDVKVERDGRVIYCAGALAHAYEALGGEVHYAGKPYPPIYHLALARASELRGGAPIDKTRVIAIGDGVNTDIAGANKAGIASVYVASRVHLQADETLESAAQRLFGDVDAPKPVAMMPELAW